MTTAAVAIVRSRDRRQPQPRAGAPVIDRGDCRAPRQSANTNLAFLATLSPPVAADVQIQPLSIAADDGAEESPRAGTRAAIAGRPDEPERSGG